MKTAQISPMAYTNTAGIVKDRNKGILFGNNDFYAENERKDDIKLVNISIDELDEDEVEKLEKVERSKWIEVIRENSGQSLHQRIVQQYQDNNNKIDANNREQQVNEKRKKFMQAYQ